MDFFRVLSHVYRHLFGVAWGQVMGLAGGHDAGAYDLTPTILLQCRQGILLVLL